MYAWGDVGHLMINHLAAQNLPASLPAFVRNPNGVDVIEWLGPEPDRWRNPAESALVAEQAPDHFINLEHADLVGTLPRHRYDFIRALAEAQKKYPELTLTPEAVGMQPYIVEEIWEKLKVDFRNYRALAAANQDTAPVQAAILYDIGWMGHYVGDGSQPLHTSIQYNGWVGPDPHGYTRSHEIHWKFEGIYVAANVKTADVAPLVAAAPDAVTTDDEWDSYLAYLRHSNTLAEEVYILDKTKAFDGAGTPEGKTFVDQQLAAGAIELRNLVVMAWARSAEPVKDPYAK
jgi:hypothetical protein